MEVASLSVHLIFYMGKFDYGIFSIRRPVNLAASPLTIRVVHRLTVQAFSLQVNQVANPPAYHLHYPHVNRVAILPEYLLVIPQASHLSLHVNRLVSQLRLLFNPPVVSLRCNQVEIHRCIRLANHPFNQAQSHLFPQVLCQR